MPRLPKYVLNSVVYLYGSVNEAEEGETSGGTGVVIAVLSDVRPEIAYLYAVTNAHVIDGAPVLRLTKTDDTSAALGLTPADWVRHQNGDDVALYELEIPDNVFRITPIDRRILVSKEDFHDTETRAGIGVGDDVCVVGRFLGYDGKEMNEPSVRFGNISVIPRKPIRQDNGHDQESILVEARSLPGNSGSPVFFVEQHATDRRTVLPAFDLKLLGLDWGHLHTWERVKLDNRRTPHPGGWGVSSNAGMMCVVPAWQIAELLDDPRVKPKRDVQEAEFRNAI